ncbi:hypothetical protein GCM10018781_36970 [Kitasatospora indigofera]|uniref:Uncharacterized protein n=1 Tax=Kitasatospora indigofera TaxID=67307 RepID=A0A919KU30_9ACTN|nr:hypothetical protein GCM10018781_36970 [Kitasatospora indigofera]
MLCTRAALAAKGGMSIGWCSSAPAATISSSTDIDEVVACSMVPRLGEAGALLTGGRRAGRGRVAWSVLMGAVLRKAPDVTGPGLDGGRDRPGTTATVPYGGPA